MKDILLLPLALLAVILVLMPACSDDNDDLVTIEGLWATNHAVTGVALRLTFNAEGTFIWEPRDETDEHTASTGSYTFNDDVLIIFDDFDCPDQTGVYSARVDGNTLEISVQDDECYPRIGGLIGTWTRE